MSMNATWSYRSLVYCVWFCTQTLKVVRTKNPKSKGSMDYICFFLKPSCFQNKVFYHWSSIRMVRSFLPILNTSYGLCHPYLVKHIFGTANFQSASCPTTVWEPNMWNEASKRLWQQLWDGHCNLLQMDWLQQLEDYRKKLGGQTLALGWNACYWGFRHDEKARKEANYFPRSYQHSYICVRCMAQKHHKGWCPLLSTRISIRVLLTKWPESVLQQLKNHKHFCLIGMF